MLGFVLRPPALQQILHDELAEMVAEDEAPAAVAWVGAAVAGFGRGAAA